MLTTKINTPFDLGSGVVSFTYERANKAIEGIAPAPEPTSNTEVIRKMKVDTSLKNLQIKFNSELGVSVPNSLANLELDLSFINQETNNEVYLLLYLESKEKTRSIGLTYKLSSDAETMLASESLADFFERYGDSFVDTITTGKAATVIIQYHLSSRRRQLDVAAKLSGLPSNAAKLSEQLNITEDKQGENCSVYVHSYGLDDFPTGLLAGGINDIDNLIAKFSVKRDDKNESAVQMYVTFQSYAKALSANITRAKEFSNLTEEAKTLHRNVSQYKQAVQQYLQSFHPKEIDGDLLYEFASTQPVRMEGTIQNLVKLKAFKESFEQIEVNIKNSCCDAAELLSLNEQIKWFYSELTSVIHSFPHQISLPLQKAEHSQIKHEGIKHDRSDMLDLDLPTGSEKLHFKMLSETTKKIESIKAIQTVFDFYSRQLNKLQGSIQQFINRLLVPPPLGKPLIAQGDPDSNTASKVIALLLYKQCQIVNYTVLAYQVLKYARKNGFNDDANIASEIRKIDAFQAELDTIFGSIKKIAVLDAKLKLETSLTIQQSISNQILTEVRNINTGPIQQEINRIIALSLLVVQPSTLPPVTYPTLQLLQEKTNDEKHLTILEDINDNDEKDVTLENKRNRNKQFYLKEPKKTSGGTIVTAYTLEISAVCDLHLLDQTNELSSPPRLDEVIKKLTIPTLSTIKFTYKYATGGSTLPAIYIAGDFNQWLGIQNGKIGALYSNDPTWKGILNPTTNLWSWTVNLAPGSYECKIVIEPQPHSQVQWEPPGDANMNKKINVAEPPSPGQRPQLISLN